MRTLSILSILILCCVCLIGTPVRAATYQNPVWDQDGGDTYCFTYGGRHYLYWPHGQRVWCASSKDLVNWTSEGCVYDNLNQSYGGHDATAIWSPEVRYLNGKFYLYCTYVMTGGTYPEETGNKDIVVIEGKVGYATPIKFDKNTKKVLLDSDVAFIDPTVFTAPNGNLYMYFKWRGEPGTGSELKGRLMDSPTSFGGDGVVLVRSEDIPSGWGTGQIEHPHMETKNGYYILFFSWGDGNSTGPNAYKICYARSGGPLGNFTFPSSNNPMMYTGQTSGVKTPGASSGVKDGNGYNWMVYRQKKNTADDRDLVACIDRLYLHNDGTAACTATRGTSQTAPAPLP